MRIRALPFLLFSFIACRADVLPQWTPPADAAMLESESRAAFQQARAARDRLLAVQGARTVVNTLDAYDEINRFIALGINPAAVMKDSSPDPAIREAAVKAVQEGSALRSEVMLDTRVYQALSGLEGSKNLDTQTKHYLARALRLFRTAGVNQSNEVRYKIAAARDEIVKLEEEFNRNIIQGLGRIPLRASDIDGVPADYLKAHKVDADGNILVSNDREDIEPITFYANNADARRKATLHFVNRGYPANAQTLAKLIDARHRLAVLCGFPSYAEMAMQDRMAASEAGQREFLKQADLASRDAAEEQKKLLLEAKRRDDPSATSLELSDVQHYLRVIRDQRFRFNEQEARAYFPYARVKESVFEASSKMFGITFLPVKASVWHSSVEAYDVVERGVALGRIYLDMFPRPNKYQHFATYRIRQGVAGKQLPEGALICNFTAPNGDDPGLMTPSMAQTFFHEFGHLLHGIFSGRQQYADLNRPESDFIEAPSQLLEEWYKNPKVLRGFAKHYKTNEPIPAEMVERMVKAEHFGEAVLTRRQLWLANMALEYEAGDGKPDLDKISSDLFTKFVGIDLPPGTHQQASFSHLGSAGYAGAYYTYQWSLAIAKDLFTKFDDGDLLDPGPAKRYRETILNAGGSQPAAEFVEKFLGRPFNLKAYQAWLQAN
ncbi:MAG: M3 family metallopeptidase [Bryobacteraceae bacterium]